MHLPFFGRWQTGSLFPFPVVLSAHNPFTEKNTRPSIVTTKALTAIVLRTRQADDSFQLSIFPDPIQLVNTAQSRTIGTMVVQRDANARQTSSIEQRRQHQHHSKEKNMSMPFHEHWILILSPLSMIPNPIALTPSPARTGMTSRLLRLSRFATLARPLSTAPRV